MSHVHYRVPGWMALAALLVFVLATVAFAQCNSTSSDDVDTSAADDAGETLDAVLADTTHRHVQDSLRAAQERIDSLLALRESESEAAQTERTVTASRLRALEDAAQGGGVGAFNRRQWDEQAARADSAAQVHAALRAQVDSLKDAMIATLRAELADTRAEADSLRRAAQRYRDLAQGAQHALERAMQAERHRANVNQGLAVAGGAAAGILGIVALIEGAKN